MISLDEQLSGVHTAAIAGHVRPDGDAYGSCMGIYLFLKRYYPEIDAHVYLEDEYNDAFRFVSCSEEVISSYPPADPVDLFIALDSSTRDRLGNALPYFEAAARTLVIDHHVSNGGFGTVCEIQPDASSTCEIVTMLIGRDRLTKEIAEPLFMGLVTDSGDFHFPNTSERTLTAAEWLKSTGIDASRITDDVYYSKTYQQLQVMGRALSESILMLQGKVIFSVIHKKEMDFYGVGPKDLEGIVQELRLTRGVEVALFLYQTGTREYKVSMRSNGKVDVAKIASFFNGGGHERAAGCTMQGGVHDVVNNVVAQVELQLQAAGKL